MQEEKRRRETWLGLSGGAGSSIHTCSTRTNLPAVGIGKVRAGKGKGGEAVGGEGEGEERKGLKKCLAPVCKVVCDSLLGATGRTWSHSHSQCRMSYIACTPCDTHTNTNTNTHTNTHKHKHTHKHTEGQDNTVTTTCAQ